MKAKRQAAELRGRAGERLAMEALAAAGWRLLEARFKCPAGEIDLIMRRGEVVAFVEVKAGRKGGGEEALERLASGRQIARIMEAAKRYLAAHPELDGKETSFDLALVGAGGEVEHRAGALSLHAQMRETREEETESWRWMC